MDWPEPEKTKKPEFVVKTQESMISVTRKTGEVICFLYKGGTTIRLIPQFEYFLFCESAQGKGFGVRLKTGKFLSHTIQQGF